MHAVFLDVGSVVHDDDVSIEPLKLHVTNWTFHSHTSPEQTLDRIRDAEIVVSNKVILDRAILQSATRLKLICVAATGTNNVDLIAASDLNIPVCNVRDYATPSVVEHTFGLILALSRQFVSYHDAIQSDAWSRSSHFAMLDFPMRELSGKTIGIIGYGTLGKAVAKAADAFGMKVVVAQSLVGPPQVGRIELSELLRLSDVITLHCPLTKETKNLIGPDAFAQMKPTAILINTARGGIVDERALLDAIDSGKIRGAATDVLTTEPPSPEQILTSNKRVNLIVTPHIAWASVEARQRLVDQVGENIASFVAGATRNVVNSIH